MKLTPAGEGQYNRNFIIEQTPEITSHLYQKYHHIFNISILSSQQPKKNLITPVLTKLCWNEKIIILS